MNRYACGMIFILFFIPAAARLMPADDWMPVSADELALKECPAVPGAAAICLYREEKFDHGEFSTSVYRRIKILTAAGREYANIEIPFHQELQYVDGLKARVIFPDNRIVPFSGKVFEKTVARLNRARMSMKTFTLPDVEAGVIIEYRYHIGFNAMGLNRGSADDFQELYSLTGSDDSDRPYEGGVDSGSLYCDEAHEWKLQDELYTVKARFLFKPLTSDILVLVYGAPMRTSWVSQQLKDIKPAVNKKEQFELELSDIPPLQEEDFMPPEGTVRQMLRFYYSNRDIRSAEDFWKHEIEAWRKGADKFIGKPAAVADEAQRIIAGAIDPAKRLARLYEWAQELRNLSYEPDLTRREWKEKGIKENRKATDVIERRYGVRSDITRTFVALARAAGFTAETARVSCRNDKFFQKNLPDLYGQFDAEVAIVNVQGRDVCFDPATPFCPLGTLPWSRSATTGIRQTGAPEAAFFSLPAPEADASSVRYAMTLALDKQGTLSGTVTATFTGQEALERRLSTLFTDEAGMKKEFEDGMAEALMPTAHVTLQKIENLDAAAPNLVATFDISIPNFAMPAGRKLLLPLSPLQGEKQHPFRHATRTHNIYFSYPYRNFDNIVITLPAGFKLESKPAPRLEEPGFARFALTCFPEAGNRVRIQRDLLVKNHYFPASEYGRIKALFDTVQASDQEQLILAPEGQ
jgi:hypothetical protein